MATFKWTGLPVTPVVPIRNYGDPLRDVPLLDDLGEFLTGEMKLLPNPGPGLIWTAGNNCITAKIKTGDFSKAEQVLVYYKSAPKLLRESARFSRRPALCKYGPGSRWLSRHPSTRQPDRLPLIPSATPKTGPHILAMIFPFVGTESFFGNGRINTTFSSTLLSTLPPEKREKGGTKSREKGGTKSRVYCYRRTIHLLCALAY